jgi:endonuclease III
VPGGAQRWPLAAAVKRLSGRYGPPAAPPRSDPLALILWENVAYLADEAKRRAAFARLEKATGLDPRRILAASDAALEACVAAPGRFAALQAQKLRACAGLALEEHGGDLGRVLALPRSAALRALRKFPAIGEPGAEKILTFAGKGAVLPLESNGLRVLVRLGFGAEEKDYRRTWRSVQEAVAPELEGGRGWLVRAHLLLQTHGKELCRRASPDCPACPLVSRCPSAG